MKISQLLYREDKWMKGGLAKTKTGKIIHNLNIHHLENGREYNPATDCVAYSLQGAIAHLYGGDGVSDVASKLGEAARKYTGRRIYLAEFNEDPSTTFEDVQNVLKIANL